MDIPAVDVLVIEDDMPIQRLLKHIVERLGLGCECVSDGVDGLAAIRERNPKVIILDLLLPRANGFEVLRHLHDHTPDVLARVIIVTAAAQSTYAGCKEIGMTRTLIRKPINLELLCSEITACHEAAATVRNV
ncbi:MAG TPA: response regulator [Thermoanaerobaculia bacterium]|jgi:CheY-like chemotaxis protein|nr:response regulator [Thermoanaerobaculia bacterium]